MLQIEPLLVFLMALGHRLPQFRSTPRADDDYEVKRFAILGVVVAVLALAGVCVMAFVPSTGVKCCSPSRSAIVGRSVAIATLHKIWSAQSQCQASGVIDTNNNGQGEYGYFGELAGRTAIRGNTQSITQPVLSAAFGNIVTARVQRSGYTFQVFLPSTAAAGVAEDETGGDVTNDNGVDPGQAELLWCCYAWPCFVGKSGNGAFFINQSGNVLASRNNVTKYSGTSRPPKPMAAFLPTETNMGGRIAVNTIGTDGESWSVVK